MRRLVQVSFTPEEADLMSDLLRALADRLDQPSLHGMANRFKKAKPSRSGGTMIKHVLTYAPDKETPGTWRFAQVTQPGEDAIAPTFYVKKKAIPNVTDQTRMTVTIEIS